MISGFQCSLGLSEFFRDLLRESSRLFKGFGNGDKAGFPGLIGPGHKIILVGVIVIDPVRKQGLKLIFHGHFPWVVMGMTVAVGMVMIVGM